MRHARATEALVKRTCFRASPGMDKTVWTEVSIAHQTASSASGRGRLLRAIGGSHLTKLAAAAAILLVALVLWKTLGTTSKAYALSDAIGIIGRAKTIHMRMLMFKDRLFEYWYDIENGREYTYHDGVYPKAYDSPETYRKTITTISDGQYVMNMDHVRQTVRFERMLSWEQELRRRRLADLAMNTALPSVLQHLNQYTKIGRDTIDGQSYDIWRREWRVAKQDFRFRYDIWVSPNSAEIGRTRRWDYGKSMGWILLAETDKIELNREPPPSTFATEPPDSYALENSKATADVIRNDFLQYQSHQGNGSLYALPGFRLEDGSIVAIWTVTRGFAEPDPNRAFAGLTFGGPLPQTPIALPGLMFASAGRGYGAVADWDESTPITLIDAVGRHLMSTNKAGRVYEWAIYVPHEIVSNWETEKRTFTVVREDVANRGGAPSMVISLLNSVTVTPEQCAYYLADAFSELSQDPTLPAFMNYGSLLNLAKRIRKERSLYEDFAREVKELKERTAGPPEPVPVTSSDGFK